MSWLIDIGVNLTHRSFARDRAEVIARAQGAGVRILILTGTSVAHSREALALAQQHPGTLFSTAGVHPHESGRCSPATRGELRELLQSPQVVAVGECGLDFNRNFAPRPVQERVFADQLALAAEVKKPLFLHERDAHPELLQILDREGPLTVPAVVHCFTGSAQALSDYLDRGLFIGITGWICDERRGRPLQELVRRIPLDRLMLETDAPFLLPRDLPRTPSHEAAHRRGETRNEPANLAHIAAVVARCMDRPLSAVTAATTANARRFFGLPERA